jgi:hypothetical protein
MPTTLTRTRIEMTLAILLVVAFGGATWSCFTAWGIMAASVGAQTGTMAQQANNRATSQSLFDLMILFQVAMLTSAIWFVARKRSNGGRGELLLSQAPGYWQDA